MVRLELIEFSFKFKVSTEQIRFKKIIYTHQVKVKHVRHNSESK